MNSVELGCTISRDFLKARWSYAELTSSRFADSYKSLVPAPLFDRARDGVPFDDLQEEDRRVLARAVVTHPGRSGLTRRLDGFETFVCVAWTRDQLLKTICVPGLGWIPLAELVSMPGPFEDSHPRAAAEKFPAGEEFRQKEPIIVLPEYNDGNHCGPLLLDGTFRSTMFLRSREPSARILVWVPAS